MPEYKPQPCINFRAGTATLPGIAVFPRSVLALPVLTWSEATLRVETLRAARGNTTLQASSSENLCNVGVNVPDYVDGSAIGHEITIA